MLYALLGLNKPPVLRVVMIPSDLINSYAWDTAIVFIQKYSGDSDYSRQNSLNTTLVNTGTIGNERCHINDIASLSNQ